MPVKIIDYRYDAWKSEWFIGRQRLGKHIPAEAKVRSNSRAVFTAVRDARVATRRSGKHISAAVNQQATISEAVFSVGAAPRLYNEDLTLWNEN
jgi:predicted transcriptional regulator